MINTTLDFLSLFFEVSPFLFSLILYTFLAIILAKHIKRHAHAYYWTFGILSSLYFVPLIFRLLGIETEFTPSTLPVLRDIIAVEFSNAAYFVHPVFVIIMYMGAFDTKHPYVARLMSIRKELSIIVGFPTLAHAVKRLFFTFPRSWNYFFEADETGSVAAATGSAGSIILNTSLFIGLFITILFIILWVTSFGYFHRTLTRKQWKKIQWWSYPFYALLFLQAFGLHLSSLIRYNDKMSQNAEKPRIEQVEKTKEENSQRKKAFSLADIEVPRNVDSYINMSILVLVYGSYTIKRTRKAKRDKQRRKKRASATSNM